MPVACDRVVVAIGDSYMSGEGAREFLRAAGHGRSIPSTKMASVGTAWRRQIHSVSRPGSQSPTRLPLPMEATTWVMLRSVHG